MFSILLSQAPEKMYEWTMYDIVPTYCPQKCNVLFQKELFPLETAPLPNSHYVTALQIFLLEKLGFSLKQVCISLMPGILFFAAFDQQDQDGSCDITAALCCNSASDIRQQTEWHPDKANDVGGGGDAASINP